MSAGKPVSELLDQLEAQVRIARAALDDEHEGDFRRAVGFLALDAGALGEIVATW